MSCLRCRHVSMFGAVQRLSRDPVDLRRHTQQSELFALDSAAHAVKGPHECLLTMGSGCACRPPGPSSPTF